MKAIMLSLLMLLSTQSAFADTASFMDLHRGKAEKQQVVMFLEHTDLLVQAILIRWVQY